MRYEKECLQLAELAKRQLNLDKNRVKRDFEELDIYHVFNLIKWELEELEDEFFKRVPIHRVIKDNINYQNVSNEIGDLTGCIVGLLAWINKEKENNK